MTVSSMLSKNDPRMVAWKIYKETEEYKNTRRWALKEAHVDGSLWAAFEEGFKAAWATPPQEHVVSKHADECPWDNTRMTLHRRCTCGVAANEALDDLVNKGTPPVEHVEADPALIGIAEEIEESGGHWQPCSGCYDTEDGHPTQKYDYSPALQTAIGCGCHECGGLGAVWWHMTEEQVASFADDMDAIDDDAIDAIQRMMDKKGLTRKDVFPAKSRASECMSRKRPLSIAMIRKLHFEHGIPAEVLIAPYRVVTEGSTNEV